MKGLTKRQSEIVNFIQEFINNHRYSPSYREIGNRFGFSSLGSVYKHINALKRKGLLQAQKRFSRSMVLTAEPQQKKGVNEIEIPFIGHISAGNPIQTFSQTQVISVPHSFVQALEKTYALRAQGESLMEEMIADGDFIIVEARHEAHPGETVIALINNRETILKRYYPEGDYVKLLGNNPVQQPIILRREDMLIQGVVVGLMRHFG